MQRTREGKASSDVATLADIILRGRRHGKVAPQNGPAARVTVSLQRQERPTGRRQPPRFEQQPMDHPNTYLIPSHMQTNLPYGFFANAGMPRRMQKACRNRQIVLLQAAEGYRRSTHCSSRLKGEEIAMRSEEKLPILQSMFLLALTSDSVCSARQWWRWLTAPYFRLNRRSRRA